MQERCHDLSRDHVSRRSDNAHAISLQRLIRSGRHRTGCMACCKWSKQMASEIRLAPLLPLSVLLLRATIGHSKHLSTETVMSYPAVFSGQVARSNVYLRTD